MHRRSEHKWRTKVPKSDAMLKEAACAAAPKGSTFVQVEGKTACSAAVGYVPKHTRARAHTHTHTHARHSKCLAGKWVRDDQVTCQQETALKDWIGMCIPKSMATLTSKCLLLQNQLIWCMECWPSETFGFSMPHQSNHKGCT